MATTNTDNESTDSPTTAEMVGAGRSAKGGLGGNANRRSSRIRRIFYWVTTIYVALAMFVGGVSELLDASLHIEFSSIGIATVVAVLGYPLYFVYIIGVAKVLGAIAIVVPRFPRLKEWAYAGLFVNMTGAFLSWLIVTVIQGVPIPAGYGSPAFHVLNALHLLVMITVSWFLRPETRVLGKILRTSERSTEISNSEEKL